METLPEKKTFFPPLNVKVGALYKKELYTRYDKNMVTFGYIKKKKVYI